MTVARVGSPVAGSTASTGWIGSYQISVIVVTVRSVVCSSTACTALAASESLRDDSLR